MECQLKFQISQEVLGKNWIKLLTIKNKGFLNEKKQISLHYFISKFCGIVC